MTSPLEQGPPKLCPNRYAMRSTGPRTEDGKAISSRNSTIHGLTAKRVVIPGEDPAEFDALLVNLTGDRKPEGELEIQLTGEIAACLWRLARARDHEAGLLETAYDLYDRGAHKLELVMRYTGSIERQMHRSIARLELCQKTRRQSAAGQFVSQVADNTVEAAPLVMVVGRSGSYETPAPEASEFVSQVAEKAVGPAPLVMVARQSGSHEAPSPEEPEFVSQVADNPVEALPLVMVAGQSGSYEAPVPEEPEFVSQVAGNRVEAASLVMVAGQSHPAPAPHEPEFVSQVAEKAAEPKPLVMVAGRSVPYEADELAEPEFVSQPYQNNDQLYDPIAEREAIHAQIAAMAAEFGEEYPVRNRNKRRNRR